MTVPVLSRSKPSERVEGVTWNKYQKVPELLEGSVYPSYWDSDPSYFRTGELGAERRKMEWRLLGKWNHVSPEMEESLTKEGNSECARERASVPLEQAYRGGTGEQGRRDGLGKCGQFAEGPECRTQRLRLETDSKHFWGRTGEVFMTDKSENRGGVEGCTHSVRGTLGMAGDRMASLLLAWLATRTCCRDGLWKMNVAVQVSGAQTRCFWRCLLVLLGFPQEVAFGACCWRSACWGNLAFLLADPPLPCFGLFSSGLVVSGRNGSEGSGCRWSFVFSHKDLPHQKAMLETGELGVPLALIVDLITFLFFG